ncbi:hypothetical protein V2J09_003072 [Rumex salicifolius]
MTIEHTLCKIILMALLATRANAEAQVPCFFVFGDSLSDSGNNNPLTSTAKSDYLPYGIDFPGGPTGRFCNGRTTIDLVGELLGLDGYIPSFPRSQQGEDAIKGVNYASGSSGIRQNTGYQAGQRICMDEQLQRHRTIISRIQSSLGENATNHLGQCLYSVYVGSNDWILDHFSPSPGPTATQFTPEGFADELLTKLTDQLYRLHEMGAKKIVLFGLGPLGCLPPLNTFGTCTSYVNLAIKGYNDKLKSLVDRFNSEYTDSKFIFIDTIEIVGMDLSGLGLPIRNVPCCELVGVSCVPLSVPCANRETRAYWDAAHPTEAANKVLAKRAYEAQGPTDSYPMDISSLAKLELSTSIELSKNVIARYLLMMRIHDHHARLNLHTAKWIIVGLIEMMIGGVNGKAEVPCLFIFGDSLSDSGNNNGLATVAKANFYPYGIDFPGGPTGRFTNGRTTVDLIGDLLGLDGYIPPFPKSGGADALKGVNYASGSAGIRPTTGYQVGQRVSMDMQLKNHQATVSRITSLIGGTNNATSHLGKCIYSVYVASNDWMIDYFNPMSASTRLHYTPQAFADALLTQLTHQLTSLYEMGARKVVLFGVGPLGCLPALNTLGTCTQYINDALQDYNNKLRLLADNFNSNLSDSKFIYINTIGIVGNDLSGLGLRVRNIPCCGALEVVCMPISSPCMDRDSHAYWDNAHPTEAANKVLASRAYKARDSNDAYPVDISRLAALQI